MPRTVTFDELDLIQFQVFRDTGGTVRVHCEYGLKSGGQVAFTR